MNMHYRCFLIFSLLYSEFSTIFFSATYQNHCNETIFHNAEDLDIRYFNSRKNGSNMGIILFGDISLSVDK